MTSVTIVGTTRLWAAARSSVRLPRVRVAWLLFWVLIMALLVLPITFFLLVAISPRLFGQGDQWLSLDAWRSVASPVFLPAILDSLAVGLAAGVAATTLGAVVAWVVQRTDLPLRQFWGGAMFALLLVPSYLIALGWQRLVEAGGVLDVLGVPDLALRQLIYGPVGVVLVLAVKGLPFAYLALSSALRGLGDEFEAAARVRGAGRLAATRIVIALLAPAGWSAFAIVFAESVSDFGVGATLASAAHFPLATYALYNAVEAFPVDFPTAAAIGWVLLAMAGLALWAQNHAMRGRSYQVLNGRSRTARLHVLRGPGRWGTLTGLWLLMALAIGVPVFGAVSASLVRGLGSLATSHGLTLDNYRRVLDSPALHEPLLFSLEMGLVTATATITLALVASRLLASGTSGLAGRALDLLLLTAVALPGIVFAAGYIFTYNLPVMNTLGVHIYQTNTLLFLAYVATALPSTTRVLVGSVSQVHASLPAAARVHGSGPARSWLHATLPLLARPMISAWLLVFSGTLLELPVSELLYVPGQPPLAVGITKTLSTYDFGGGTAMEVLAIMVALGVMGVVWGAWALFAPRGWRRLGVAAR